MYSLCSRFLDLLYPPRCRACGAPNGPRGLCRPCRARIEAPHGPSCPLCGLVYGTAIGPDHVCLACLRRPPAFRRARACALYRTAEPPGPLATMLHRYKYDRDVTLAKPLGDLLHERAPLAFRDYDLVMPVPLHPARLRWRGFNQALLLLRPQARAARVPVDPFCLQRRRETKPQVELRGADRRANVAGAFVVTQRASVEDRRILLVDDVYTTGATADECCRALRRAGAGSVDVLVLARAVRN